MVADFARFRVQSVCATVPKTYSSPILVRFAILFAAWSWCIRRNPLVLGRGDKWATASLPSLSEFNVPLTAQHLHLRLPVLNTSTVVPYGRGSIHFRQPEMKMLGCERYIGFGSCWFHRNMVCWGGARPRPGPRLPPLEGGGRQPCNGLRVVLPPVRKSPVRRAAAGRVRRALTCRQDCGPCGGVGVAQMHGAVDRTHAADVRRVCDRPRDRPARCLRLCCRRSASGCHHDVQCGYDACRCAWSCAPNAATVTAGLLAGAARQRAASRGAQSAE